jgi:hypothetical protein
MRDEDKELYILHSTQNMRQFKSCIRWAEHVTRMEAIEMRKLQF